MWNTPLEKNRCFKFLRSVFDSTDTDVMYICGIRNRTDWCVFDRSPITSFWEKCVHVKYSVGENRCFKFLRSVFDSTDTDVMYICGIRNRTDWCIFDRSPITSFWEKCVHVKYSVGEKPMFQISAKCLRFNRHRCDVYMRYQKPNRLMYFRPFSHH